MRFKLLQHAAKVGKWGADSCAVATCHMRQVVSIAMLEFAMRKLSTLAAPDIGWLLPVARVSVLGISVRSAAAWNS